MDRKDLAGDFIRSIAKQVGLRGAGSNQICLTADGKILHTKGDPHIGMRAWKRLPPANRRPGFLQLPLLSKVDASNAVRRPPEGSLVIKQYYRMMAYTSGKRLRYVTIKDFTTPIGNNQSGRLNPAYYVPHPDYVWITKAEWKSLIPANPTAGSTYPMPGRIAERIYRFHMNPVMAFGESSGLKRDAYSKAKMDLTVAKVTDSEIHLRLSGSVRIGSSYDETRKSKRRWGYEPTLRGHLVVDRRAGKFLNFDIVAIGDFFGQLNRDDPFYRPGRNPLGISFGLVDASVPRNQVAPRGAYRTNYKSYFGTGK